MVMMMMYSIDFFAAVTDSICQRRRYMDEHQQRYSHSTHWHYHVSRGTLMGGGSGSGDGEGEKVFVEWRAFFIFDIN